MSTSERSLPSRHARSSFYLTMRDGVKIAVDLYLPARGRAQGRVPTILHQTRYLRYWQYRWPLDGVLGGSNMHQYETTRRVFLDGGYAWVDVDARGSGGSFGSRPCAFSSDEIRDGGQVVSWIAAQPWSNGRVGATGISY